MPARTETLPGRGDNDGEFGESQKYIHGTKMIFKRQTR
jgi:hypothetical protein